MLYGSHRGFDIYFTVYVTNQASGKSTDVPDIYGYRGVVVKSGLPEGDPSGVRFSNEPQEGYRDPDLADHFASVAGRLLVDRLANVIN
jgi:hypothetical protein